MYIPKHFSETRVDVLHDAIRRHPLATFITHSARGVEADPIPFLLRPGEGLCGELWGHVARANPLWRDHPVDIDVLAVFSGVQAYVSPNWYPGKQEHHKVVPTWNYVTVQARGQLQIVDDPVWVRDLVSALTAEHEAAQQAPWSADDAPADYIASMLKAIVGIRIVITELTGKWKLSQNQPATNRAGVIAGLQAQHADVASVMTTMKDEQG